MRYSRPFGVLRTRSPDSSAFSSAERTSFFRIFLVRRDSRPQTVFFRQHIDIGESVAQKIVFSFLGILVAVDVAAIVSLGADFLCHALRQRRTQSESGRNIPPYPAERDRVRVANGRGRGIRRSRSLGNRVEFIYGGNNRHDNKDTQKQPEADSAEAGLLGSWGQNRARFHPIISNQTLAMRALPGIGGNFPLAFLAWDGHSSLS